MKEQDIQHEDLREGQIITRTQERGDDSQDGFLNIICGSVFQVTKVNEHSIEVVCVHSGGYPPETRGEMSFPMKYLSDRKLFHVDDGKDKAAWAEDEKDMQSIRDEWREYRNEGLGSGG